MSNFNFSVEFVGNPSAELNSVVGTKDYLKYIGKTFGISYSHKTKKSPLKSMVLSHLGVTGCEKDNETEARSFKLH